MKHVSTEKSVMVRMSDIAKRVGVSRATVSAVLNDHHEKLGIKPETARRIRETAEKLGYFRNEMAVAIKTGQNAVIGCITVGLDQEWIARVLTGLLETAQEAGYLIKIVNLKNSDDCLDSLRRLVRQRMAGIFCCNAHPPRLQAKEFRQLCTRYAMPVVAINSSDLVGGYHLRSDDLQGTEQAVGHLWKLGHRQIAHITGDPTSMTGPFRRDGFLQAMSARGAKVPAAWVVAGSYDVARAEAATLRFLQRKGSLPTAIFCANDDIAATTVRAALSLGLRVPEDLSIVGYSSIKVGELTSPPLTTIAQPFEKMGSRAAEVLLHWIQEKRTPAEGLELLPTKLIVRASTGKRG